MSAATLRIPMFCLLAAAVVAIVGWVGQPRVSGGADVKDAAGGKWEYVTGSIETGSLQARLTELGNDGWEVFSIERVDSVVDQTADGKTHLTSEKLEVTAKRPARK